ncbi:hypothetical protein L596_002175 [Steinernema carpocapsae]|nr:hypothetical protein L596_002175 [Steinernema carpocapsae]
MESFITNETSPDTCTLAHRLQKLPWSIAFQILQCIMGAAASACLPWMIRTHRRCMQCYHGNVYPILVNLHSLTFYHVAALLMRLVFVISRHLSRSDDCGYIYSAFTCHISSQAPKLSFYSLGTNVCALLLEQVAGLYGRLNIHKRRGNVFVALGFVVTYVPTVVQLAQFIYGAIALWQLDISVVYCSPYMNPVPDLAVLEPFIEGVQIGIIVVMVVGASLLGYSLHNIET